MPEMTWSQMRDEAKKQGFEPLPIGTFDARVEGTKVVSGKGSQQIQLKLVVATGPIAGRSTVTRLVPYKNDGEVNGMFFQQAAALGVPDTDPLWGQMEQLGFEQGLGLLAQRVDGQMVIIDVDHQNYNGEVRDNVTKMRPYQGMIPGTNVGAPMQPGGMLPQAPPPPPPPPPPVQQVPQQPQMPQQPYQQPVVEGNTMVPTGWGTTVTAPAPTQAPVVPMPQAPVPPPAPPQPPVAPSPQEVAPATPMPAPAPAPYQPEQPPAPGGVQPVAPVENPSI